MWRWLEVTRGRWLEATRGRWLAIGLAGIGLALLASAVVGERGVVRIAFLRHELGAANDQNFQLLQAIDHTRKQLRAIRQDDAALERLARRRLRLVRDGETIYQLEPTAEASATRENHPGQR
jgi:cell division protein FtsB